MVKDQVTVNAAVESSAMDYKENQHVGFQRNDGKFSEATSSRYYGNLTSGHFVSGPPLPSPVLGLQLQATETSASILFRDTSTTLAVSVCVGGVCICVYMCLYNS